MANKDESKIETLQGTMTAFAWHVGKHVAADPSGYNWRILDEDVDTVIEALETPGAIRIIQDDVIPDKRSRVKLTHALDGSAVIEAMDTVSGGGTDTVLSNAGRLQFLDVLRSVMDRPNDVKQEVRDQYNQWLRDVERRRAGNE